MRFGSFRRCLAYCKRSQVFGQNILSPNIAVSAGVTVGRQERYYDAVDDWASLGITVVVAAKGKDLVTVTPLVTLFLR